MDEPSIQPGGAAVSASYPGGGLLSEREESLRTLTDVLYGLYAIHWLTGGITRLWSRSSSTT